MTPSILFIAALLGVAGVVAYFLGRAWLAKIYQGGEDASRADRAEADLRVAKKQAEVMAQRKDMRDAISDLDAGRFFIPRDRRLSDDD